MHSLYSQKISEFLAIISKNLDSFCVISHVSAESQRSAPCLGKSLYSGVFWCFVHAAAWRRDGEKRGLALGLGSVDVATSELVVASGQYERAERSAVQGFAPQNR